MEYDYDEASKDWVVVKERVNDYFPFRLVDLYNDFIEDFVLEEQNREANDSIVSGIGSIIGDYVELCIRGVVFECVDLKVNDLSIFWGYDYLPDELRNIDRYLVTSRILEEL